MEYRVLITENGTERIAIVDSYLIPGKESEMFDTITEHVAATENPHHTSLQQVVTNQGTVPIIEGFSIGSSNENEYLLRLLKHAIYFAVNGAVKHTNIDVNGFYHVTEDGHIVEIDNGGIRLSGSGNTITVNFDGTITGLAESTLYHSAATRGYVESLALGLKPHAPVKIMLEKGVDVFTFIAEGTGVGKTITASQNEVFQYQGLLYSLGERIGVKCYGYQQVDAGIYTITHLGSPTSPWVLTRAVDFDGSTSYETKQADILFVQEGRFAKSMFIETNRGSEPDTGNLVIDTDLVVWELFHKPQDLVFEQGLNQNGQSVSVKPDVSSLETIIPVSVSTNGVGVQKSIVSAIADAKKIEANAYTDSQTQLVLQESNAHAEQLAQENITYTDEQIQQLEANIPSLTQSVPMLYPQFHVLNGATIQNYSDYLYIDNAYRSGNDSGLQSNNCIPFLIPKNGSLQGVRFYIGYVAVAGAYIDYSQVSIHFELRRITNTATVHIHTLTAITNGLSDKIGSYGIFPPNPVQVGGGVSGLNTELTAGYLYGIKFIHDTTGSPVIASAVRNVILRLEIKLG